MMSWKEVPAPARKVDYRYKFLRLLDTPPRQRIGYGPDGSYWKRELPIRAGDVVQISMRRSAAETGISAPSTMFPPGASACWKWSGRARIACIPTTS